MNDINADGTTANALSFVNISTERMRIDSSGNLLMSSGYIRPTAGSGDNGIIFPADPGGGGGDIASIKYYSTGVDTTKLVIKVENDGDAINHDDLELGAAASIILCTGYTHSATPAYTERMRIDTTGNVGIGINAPKAELHVYGDPQYTANLTDSGPRGGMIRLSGASPNYGSGGAVVFANSQGDSVNSVGFAAIKGFLVDGSNNTSGLIAFSTRRASTDTALTEAMRIDTSGNIGIGTSYPTEKLSVSGGAIFSGYGSNAHAGYTNVMTVQQPNGNNWGLVVQNTTAGNDYGLIFWVGNSGIAYISYGTSGSYNDAFSMDPSTGVTVAEGRFAINSTAPPITYTQSGTAGELRYDSNYLYICVATNTWKRVLLSSF